MRISARGAAVVIGIWLAGAATAAAQTVDEIVAKHIAARGGAEKLKAIQTIKVSRTIGTPFTKVNVVTFRKRPNLLRTEQTPATGQKTVSGINATAVWDPAPQGKYVLRPEPMAAQAREIDGDFDGDLLVDWKEKGHTVTFEGKENVGGVETLKLKVTTKSGGTREIYLDASTFLDRQHVGATMLPNGRKREFTIVFSNWKDVEGVKFWFDADEERREGPINQSFAFYTQGIELNVPMEDALFATPEGAAPPPQKK